MLSGPARASGTLLAHSLPGSVKRRIGTTRPNPQRGSAKTEYRHVHVSPKEHLYSHSGWYATQVSRALSEPQLPLVIHSWQPHLREREAEGT